MLFPSGNPFKCHEEVLYLQPLIPPKRFDISPPLTGGCSEGLEVRSDFPLNQWDISTLIDPSPLHFYYYFRIAVCSYIVSYCTNKTKIENRSNRRTTLDTMLLLLIVAERSVATASSVLKQII